MSVGGIGCAIVVRENCFEVEFCKRKVEFVVQQLHGPEILKTQHFGELCSVCRLLYILLALPGAVR